MKQIYKITYPSGKIYVGSDVTGDLLYLGSPSAAGQIAADLGLANLPRKPLVRHGAVVVSDGSKHTIDLVALGVVLRKEILWESDTHSDREVIALEMQFIRDARANDPNIGYNKVPKYGKVKTGLASRPEVGRDSPQHVGEGDRP